MTTKEKYMEFVKAKADSYSSGAKDWPTNELQYLNIKHGYTSGSRNM